MRAILCGLAFCVLPLSSVAQRPSRVPVDDVPTGMITGQVVATDVQPQPIRRAVVTVKNPAIADRQVVTTDDGRFALAGLPAGRYLITAEKAAYVRTVYGASSVDAPGTPVALARNGHFDVTIPLIYGAVLSGTITNTKGDAMPAVQVSALRVRGSDTRAMAYGETDDRGVYRIFGLAPGSYLVSATQPIRNILALGSGHAEQPSVAQIDAILAMLRNRSDSASPGVGGTGAGPVLPRAPSVAFAPAYYPGTPSPEEASRVTLAAAAEQGGLDFVFDPVATATVAGTISGPVDDPGNVSITLQPSASATTPFTRHRSTRAASDGRFAFSDVPPGRYTVAARASAGQETPAPSVPRMMVTGAGTTSTKESDLLYDLAEVDVRGTNVEVALSLAPGATLAGRVVFDLTPARVRKGRAPIRIALSPVGGGRAPVASSNGFATTRDAQVRPDGSFVVTGLAPGAYSLRALLPPDMNASGWWAKSARVQNRDLLDVEIVVTTGQRVDGLVVTLSDRRTVLSGVLQAAGQPAEQYLIVAFSTDPEIWRALARRTQVVRPAADGTFEIRDLPPGDYFVAVAATIDSEALQTTSFFEQIAAFATRVTLGDGERRGIDLEIAR